MVGSPSYTPAATASSGLAVAITLDGTSTGCALSGGVVSFPATGTCVIDFNQAGNSSYNAAPQVQQSIAIGAATKSAQSITVTSTAPSGVVVGSPSYTPAATASSGLAVAITLDGTSTGCALSGGVVSFPATGTCVIDFNQAGNSSYNAAPQVQQSIAIGTATGFPAGWHKLVIANNGLCLDSFGNTSNPGAVIDQSTCVSQLNQQFQFVATSGGYGELEVESSTQYVTVLSNSTTQGQTDMVQEPLAYPASQWLPVRQSDGSYEFKNKISGLCLDVYHAGANVGQQLDQWPCKNGPGNNQDFKPQ